MSERSREGRKPFTFWFDEALKVELKTMAKKLGTTTTDLINRAVKIYLEKGLLHDDENNANKILTSSILAGEITTSMLDERVNELSNIVKGTVARLNDLEEQINRQMEMIQKIESRPPEEERAIMQQAEIHKLVNKLVNEQVSQFLNNHITPIIQQVSSKLESIK